jgi:RNA polymerase sigma-70 factor (ECF subfamily)
MKDRISREVIIAAKNGNRDAFAQIYGEFRDFVWNMAIKASGNIEHAEDITGEIFFRLYRKIGKFKFRSSFETWFYRVAYNAILNYLDREKRRCWNILSDREEESALINDDVIAASTDPDLEMIRKVLSGMKNDDRIILLMREVECFSYDEIAGILNVNVGTVKSRMYRARSQLRKKYRQLCGEKDEL